MQFFRDTVGDYFFRWFDDSDDIHCAFDAVGDVIDDVVLPFEGCDETAFSINRSLSGDASLAVSGSHGGEWAAVAAMPFGSIGINNTMTFDYSGSLSSTNFSSLASSCRFGTVHWSAEWVEKTFGMAFKVGPVASKISIPYEDGSDARSDTPSESAPLLGSRSSSSTSTDSASENATIALSVKLPFAQEGRELMAGIQKTFTGCDKLFSSSDADSTSFAASFQDEDNGVQVAGVKSFFGASQWSLAGSKQLEQTNIGVLLTGDGVSDVNATLRLRHEVGSFGIPFTASVAADSTGRIGASIAAALGATNVVVAVDKVRQTQPQFGLVVST